MMDKVRIYIDPIGDGDIEATREDVWHQLEPCDAITSLDINTDEDGVVVFLEAGDRIESTFAERIAHELAAEPRYQYILAPCQAQGNCAVGEVDGRSYILGCRLVAAAQFIDVPRERAGWDYLGICDSILDTMDRAVCIIQMKWGRIKWYCDAANQPIPTAVIKEPKEPNVKVKGALSPEERKFLQNYSDTLSVTELAETMQRSEASIKAALRWMRRRSANEASQQ